MPLDRPLAGPWRAHEATDELTRRFFLPGFDDRDWTLVAVPGHWRDEPTLGARVGSVLYRTEHVSEPLLDDRRRFLTLDGIMYFGDVWYDGRYLGSTEGYFQPHAFEITQLANREATSRNVVGVEVSCRPESDRRHKRMIAGVLTHWDARDSLDNPGGLWRPVHIVETGPAQLTRVQCICVEATEERGRLRLRMGIDAGSMRDVPAPFEADLHARVSGPGVDVTFDRRIELALGRNALDWTLEVDRPPRWWPRRLGEQPMVDVDITLELNGSISDARSIRTAFREVRLHTWHLFVNGERMYVKGSNLGPTRVAMSTLSESDFERDIDLALDANLDMLRVHAHIARPELYEVADRQGILLWQDFPLQWGYARSVRKPAIDQARTMIDQLGHHPSIVLWCAHNAPIAVDWGAGDAVAGGSAKPRTISRSLAEMVLPTWNKTRLDRAVKRTIERIDRSRPTIAHSGVATAPLASGGDGHYFFGWFYGEMGDLAAAMRRWPRLARFVSQYGAQAVPETDAFIQPSRYPDLDWRRLSDRHGFQAPWFDRTSPPIEHDDFESWKRASQHYQATLIQLQTEDLRRIKYRPNGGYLHHFFADAAESISFSVLDHARVPKPGYHALAAASRPVLAMLDPRTGAVHAVSDLRARLSGARVRVVVASTDGPLEWQFEGDVPSDGVVYVGRVRLPDVSSSRQRPDQLDDRGSLAIVTIDHPITGPVVNHYSELPFLAGHRHRVR